MTKFSPIKGTTTQINNTPIVDGQILFETNLNGQNHIYVDVDESRIPVGISEWSQILHKPFETLGDGLTVVNGVLSVDAQSWEQILDKPFTSIGSGLTVTNGVLSADVSTPSWDNIDNRPFTSIGNGLTVDSNNRLNADVRSVQLTIQGTGTASSSAYQRLRVNMEGTNVDSEINGSRYMEYSQNLSTSDNTVYTFNDYSITNNSAVDVFTDIYGIDPINVNIASGVCRVTFAPPETVISTPMLCRIYIK